MEISKDLARRAYSGISFEPEKRAERECSDFLNTIAEIEQKFEIAIEKNPDLKDQLIVKKESVKGSIKKRWEAYLSSQSNVMSFMITGPARFPSERNRKRAEWAYNKMSDLLSFINRVNKIINRATRVTKSINDKLEIAKNNLELQIEFHEVMKAANATLRKNGLAIAIAFLKEKGISDEVVSCFSNERGLNWWKEGFAPFQLTNSLARINHTKDQIIALETRDKLESTIINGVRIEANTNDDRVRIHFDGKPSPSTISALKSNGFRWSPTNKAWQRQLTGIAMKKAKNICENLI